MSFDDIQLPPLVIQQLYKQLLIEPGVEGSSPTVTPVNSFTILGNNNKQIVILISSDKTLYLPDGQLNFLLGILSACNLTMEDVAILNLKKNKTANYISIAAELRPKTVLLFGATASQIDLPLDFPTYQVQRFNQQVYLTAPALSQLQQDKAEKTKLWNCLKQIFSI